MASATRETVTKEVVTTEEESVIRLDLTEDEAKVILAMTRCVAGNPNTTVRKEVNTVASAIRGLGIYVYGYDLFTGSLYAKASAAFNPNLFD